MRLPGHGRRRPRRNGGRRTPDREDPGPPQGTARCRRPASARFPHRAVRKPARPARECRLVLPQSAFPRRSRGPPPSDRGHGFRETSARRNRSRSPPLSRRLSGSRRPPRAARPRRPCRGRGWRQSPGARHRRRGPLARRRKPRPAKSLRELVRRRTPPRRAGPAQSDREEPRRSRQAARRAGHRRLSRPHEGRRQGRRDGPRVPREVARRRRLDRGDRQVSLRLRDRRRHLPPGARKGRRERPRLPPARWIPGPRLEPRALRQEPPARLAGREEEAPGRPRDPALAADPRGRRQVRPGLPGAAPEEPLARQPQAAAGPARLRLPPPPRRQVEGSLRQALRNPVQRASPRSRCRHPLARSLLPRGPRHAARRRPPRARPAARRLPARHLGPTLRNQGRSDYPQGHPVDHRLVEGKRIPALSFGAHRRPDERARHEVRGGRLVALADGSRSRRFRSRGLRAAGGRHDGTGPGRRFPESPLRGRHRPAGRLRRGDRQPRLPRAGLQRHGGDPFQIRRPQRRLAFRIVQHGRMAGPRLAGGGPQRKGMAGRAESPRLPHRARFETRPPERRGRHGAAGR